jgi:hypothetical protein
VFDGKPPTEKQEMIQQRNTKRASNQGKKTNLQNDLQKAEISDLHRIVVEEEIRKLDTSTIRISSEEREKVKQILYASGILSLNAAGEADTVLAYFAKREIIQAVISNDFDLLARGVETLLVPEQLALPGESVGWSQYSLTNIELVKTHINNYKKFSNQDNKFSFSQDNKIANLKNFNINKQEYSNFNIDMIHKKGIFK